MTISPCPICWLAVSASRGANPDAVLLSGRIEDSFLRRIGDLPASTRFLLLVAAAEPTGDPVLVWQAVARLGLSMDAAGDAEAAGLVEFGARVRCRHPLVRSAVYRRCPWCARCP